MRKTSILLVDDEPAFLHSLQTELTAHGFRVSTARSKEDALDALGKKRFDLVITDHMEEGIDGIKVLKHARKMSPETGVIILTGFGDITSAIDALRLCADDYLQKPCEIEDLLFRISRCCDKKNLQTRLRAQKDFLKNVLDSLTHPFYVLDINDYTVKLANSAASRGRDYRGRTCFSLFHGRARPCAGAEHTCTIEMIRQTKKPVMLEHVHRAGNGEDKLYEIYAFPIFDREGKVDQVIEYSLDITSRRKLEQEQRRLMTAIEQSADSVVITDPDAAILYVNPAFEQVTGYSRAEAAGQNPRILQSGKHDITFYRDMWRTLTAGKTWKGVLINRRKDGVLFEEEASISPVFDNRGRVTNYVAVKRDVTRQRKEEEKFRQAQKMEAIGTLAGGIAHDFNNILSAIIGYSEFIRREAPPDSSIGRDIDKVLSSANRAAELVKQILTFSRVEKIDKQPLHPCPLVKEAVKLLKATLPSTVHIIQEIDPDCGTIMADPTSIHQVVLNLCTNALHAMDEGKGTLRITLRRRVFKTEKVTDSATIPPGAYVVLTVSDTGSGIDPAIIKEIFEPYFTTKEKGKGTGLGLAVVHGIVEDCGGFIEVRSAVGSGSAFSIYFPATQESPAPHASIPGNPPEKPGACTEKIMIVDDDPLLVKINERRLRSHGYQVTGVTDSREALRIFQRRPDEFDLLITDQTMPHMTGTDLARAVLNIKPSLPIIMCTGHRGLIDEEHKRSGNIAQYVFKPLQEDELLAAARNILDQRRRGK